METIKGLIKNKDYEKAENMLLDLITQSNNKVIEDENNTYYSFNNYIEILIFWYMYKPEKRNICPDINYSEIYYYLGFINIEIKNYGKAQEYFKKGLEWNPMDVSIMFENAYLYRMLGDIERYKAEIEKTNPFIYEIGYMAKYYRELGWYYVEKKSFDLANALYTQSLAFYETDMAKRELEFIAKSENRKARLSTAEEMQKLFRDYNITFGFNRNIVDIIIDEYNRLYNENPQPDVINFISKKLYDITLDDKYMTFYELKDENTETKIDVPFTWSYIRKEDFEKNDIAKNTAFFLLTRGNQNINIAYENKCSDEEFDDRVKLNIENIKKYGIEVEEQYRTSGTKSNIELFLRVNHNGNIIRLFQVYRVVNGYLFSAAWQVKNADIELDKLLIDVNNSFAMKVVNSLKPINEITNKQESFEVTVNNNTRNEDFTIQKINEEYANNKISLMLVKMLHIYADTKIKEDKQDPFWSKTAKNVLLLLILSNLVANENVSEKQIMEQIKEDAIAKMFIKNNIDKLLLPELSEIISSKSIIDSEKLFKSVMYIIREDMLSKLGNDIENSTKSIKPKEVSKDEKVKEENKIKGYIIKMKEYIIKMKDGTKFKLYFPENLGEYTPSKFFNNIFEIKQGKTQKIRVMINNCSEEEFEDSAKDWIKKNEKDAKMETVAYRKETINNIPIEVYELKFLEKNNCVNRIYKIGLVNNCRVIISGGIIKGKEEIINKAFKTIKWENASIGKISKKEETKPIIVNCPACNTDFELKWNVPATEKTFYCKCLNCGMEIKRSNPNYKEPGTISGNNKDKIITYLINIAKLTEKRALASYEKLNQHEDILNEFANCINEEQFNYCDNGIIVEGYSAKSLKEKVGNKLSDLGVYNYLIYLRENPDEAKQNLDAGLPVK